VASFFGFDETQPLPYLADGTFGDDTLGDHAIKWVSGARTLKLKKRDNYGDGAEEGGTIG